MTRIILLAACLLFSQAGCGADTGWLLGAYADTLNKLDVKGGIAFKGAEPNDPERRWLGPSFLYADGELGLEGVKVSAGGGHYIGHGLDRWGLSYAHFKSQDLVGLELVSSQMILSLKLGYYVGLNHTKNRLLLGAGFGF